VIARDANDLPAPALELLRGKFADVSSTTGSAA
jgi:hypothetical protein